MPIEAARIGGDFHPFGCAEHLNGALHGGCARCRRSSARGPPAAPRSVRLSRFMGFGAERAVAPDRLVADALVQLVTAVRSTASERIGPWNVLQRRS
jgi:hypothetical protein